MTICLRSAWEKKRVVIQTGNRDRLRPQGNGSSQDMNDEDQLQRLKSQKALDTAAVEAMVSLVGTYTLEALHDTKLRAQHKQQRAERLKMNDGAQVPYSDQAILANLDWGIDSLEEAITTNNEETKVARLEHAEKMLRVCALLDSRAATAGVPNCYLSAWAHFNLAFVWKLRNDDSKGANHMLEMFLVDPFYGRVDFAPALWEHLFLPHLSNVVSWYTKQRKSIEVSGTSRKMSEEQEMSFDVSRDFPSNPVNVLDPSADQRTQLQALEKLYQDSLDENTKQYARYYKGWLNYDTENSKGMPLMPIAEPPMIAESWVAPANLLTDQMTSSTGITMPVAEPILLGQMTSSSTSLSRRSSALPPLKEFNEFDNPEFVELAELPTFAGDGLDDDPDSPNSNFRRPVRELQEPERTTTPNRQSESAEHRSIPASTDRNTPWGPRLLRSTAVRHSDFGSFRFNIGTQAPIHDYGEIRSVPNSGEIRSVSNPEESRSAHKSGEIGSVPNPGESRSAPNPGKSRSAPKPGEIGSAPKSGEIRSAPSPGESGSAPKSGEIKSAPSPVDRRSTPKPGEIRLAFKSGETRSAPNPGESRSVPSPGENGSVPNSGEIRRASPSETLGDILEMKARGRWRSSRQQPDDPAASTPTVVDGKVSELRDKSSSPKLSHDSPRGRTDRRASRQNNSSSSRYSNSESRDRKSDNRHVDSERYEGFDSDLTRHSGRHQREGFNQSSNAPLGVSPEESVFSLRTSIVIPEVVNSSNEHSFCTLTTIPEIEDSSNKNSLQASTIIRNEADPSYEIRDLEAAGAPQIQGLKLEARRKSLGDSDASTGIASTTRTRFLSKYGNGSARSSPRSRRLQNDDDEPIVARSGPLLGRASERYQDDDEDPSVARSRPLLWRASERYQDDGNEQIIAQSGPLLGRASERYQDDDNEPIVARSGASLRHESIDSGSARDQGRSRRHRRSESPGSSRNSSMSTPLTRPPKDFICPITSQLFNDPVTLETGQTYERTAIQEWLNRGNVTCPITRQTLRQKHLPKTNYVLKRVVDAWKEQYPELAKEFGSSPLARDVAATGKPCSEFTERSVSSSPYNDSFSRRTSTTNNVNDISRPDSPVDVDGLMMDLKPAMNYLCTSENLAECEAVMEEIARLILQARGDQRLVSILKRAGAITGMMELLFNSQETRVLNSTLFLLSVVIAKDDTARQTVVSADPEAGCLVGLLRKGFSSSASVLFQLKLPNDQLATLDLLPLLVVVIKDNEESQGVDVWREQHDIHSMMLRPKSAAIMLLDQILTGGNQTTLSRNVQALLALQAAPALVSSLDQTKDIEVRTSVVSLLLLCIQSDGRSRNMISKITNLATLVDLLHSGHNRARTVAISFLNELVHLSRRALCTDVLKKLKAEGSLSSMRALLVYLQMAPLEHRPVAASLLLQLDLLEEPRKGSIYREEAVDSLVEALNSTDWPCPVEAATTLVDLGGRFSYSGKPMMKAWLLKIAGVDKYFLSSTKSQQDSNDNDLTFDQEEEERAAKAWERKVGGALVGHDLGTLIEALGQGIQSRNSEVSRPCMLVATWLTHMLPKLPDTGVRQTARNCLLDHFVGMLQTSKDLQQRVLAALAIHSFISDPEGVQELLSYVKDVREPLRHLTKSTWTAKEILRAFTTHGDANSPDLWVHAEQGHLDGTANGEVRALVKAKTHIVSGHSDGTIKIWEAKKRFPVLLQELKEHSKSVMALAVSLDSNRLYSGSLDKSIRIWALGTEDIHCVHVFDLKDAVVGLLVNGPMACIIPHGAGLKVKYEETATKTLNPNKHVQSIAISDGKIFCGCADNSLQELDPLSESIDVIQHGVRTLIGKKPIYSTQVFQDHLYVAGSPVDGVAGKVWKLSDRSLVGTIGTISEVRSMAMSEDFIYLGSSSGVIEVWLRERLLRVSTLNPGSKVICLMLDGDTLYSGHEDGKIRMWTMI